MLSIRFWGALGTESRRKTVFALIVKAQLCFILQDVLNTVLLETASHRSALWGVCVHISHLRKY